jgi:hypothetical protein
MKIAIFGGLFALKKSKKNIIKKVSKNNNIRNLKLFYMPFHPGAKVGSASTCNVPFFFLICTKQPISTFLSFTS